MTVTKPISDDLHVAGMSLIASLLVALVVTFAFVNDAASNEYTLGDLKIEHPWTRATPGGAKVGGGYVTITNTGPEADRLLTVKADFAGHLEIHEMSMSDGVMTMRPLDEGVELPPGETVTLKPGGLHIMFMMLKEPLKQGKTRKATLVFERAGEIEVDFPVAPIGAKEHGMSHDHGGHGSGS